MQVEKSQTTITLSEHDLKCALEYWLLVVHQQRVEIKGLTHLVGERTEGYGQMEIDVPYQDGVKLTVVDADKDYYRSL